MTKDQRADQYIKRIRLGKCADCGAKRERDRRNKVNCAKCAKRKTAAVRRLEGRRRVSKLCIECGRKAAGVRCEKCLANNRKRWTAWDSYYKRRAFQHYGNKCKCCGEREPKFLCFDHINGCGREHRKLFGGNRIAKWLCTHNFPKGFRLLCANCNLGRELNGGICPHKDVRKDHQWK